MSIYQTPLKARIALVLAVTIAILIATIAIASVWQDWTTKPVSNLPAIFWILYALNVIGLISTLILPRFLIRESRKADPNNALRVFNSVGSGIFGLLLCISPIIIGQELKGSILLFATMGAFLFLNGLENLSSYLNTRLKSSRNTPPR